MPPTRSVRLSIDGRGSAPGAGDGCGRGRGDGIEDKHGMDSGGMVFEQDGSPGNVGWGFGFGRGYGRSGDGKGRGNVGTGRRSGAGNGRGGGLAYGAPIGKGDGHGRGCSYRMSMFLEHADRWLSIPHFELGKLHTGLPSHWRHTTPHNPSDPWTCEVDGAGARDGDGHGSGDGRGFGYGNWPGCCGGRGSS